MTDPTGETVGSFAAAEALLDRLDDHAEVDHAEVGGVRRLATDAVATDDGVRNATDLDHEAVWCRVLAGGAADYRHLTAFDEDALDEAVERVVRGGKHLAQEARAGYDALSVHRGLHGGWSRDGRGVADVPVDEKADTLREAVGNADAADRVRIAYGDERVESLLLTTTGSAVRTSLDRASADFSLACDGQRVRRHAGTTRGAALLGDLPGTVADAGADLATLADHPEEPIDCVGERTVALAPRAAGQLFHRLSHLLEVDAVYAGASPLSIGDRPGPAGLTVEDGVRAGSWAARAYDAEARPTQPVTLVEDGEVASLLYDTTSAVDEDAIPAGNAVPALGFEQPPRIHSRHLDVAAGSHTDADLRSDADLFVRRFRTVRLHEDVYRQQRASYLPPSVLYGRDVATKFDEYDAPPGDGRLRLVVGEGYLLNDGGPTATLRDARLVVGPSELSTLALGSRRETTTGTCEKHTSRLPFAVTAPGVRLRAHVEPT